MDSNNTNQNDFFSQYEQKARQNAVSNTGSGLDVSSANPKGNPALTARFSSEMGDATPKPKEFKLDIGNILGSLDLNSDVTYERGDDGRVKSSNISDDENYCTMSILSGRVNVDDLADEDIPYAIAAISHSLFGQKNDFNGGILANTLKIRNIQNHSQNNGYDEDTGKWDSRQLLKSVVEAWGIISDKTHEKRLEMLNADLVNNGFLGKEDKPFFTEKDSIEQLRYQFGIAKKDTGFWDDYWKSHDNQWNASAGGGNANSFFNGGREFTYGLTDAFGFVPLVNRGGDALLGLVKGAWSTVTGDASGQAEAFIPFNYGDIHNRSHKYIIDRLFDAYPSIKRGDYGSLIKRVYAANGHTVRLSGTDVNIHVSDENANSSVPSGLWISAGNEVEYMLDVVDSFVENKADSKGVMRMANAMAVLYANPDAAEGVALFLGSRGKHDDLAFRRHGSDALRDWANSYMDEAVGDEDKNARWKTVQAAMNAVGMMQQEKGFHGSNNGFVNALAGAGNIGFEILLGAKDMAVGSYEQTAYDIERAIHFFGETKEEEEAAHRRRMVEQQADFLANNQVHDEGTLTGHVAKEVANFYLMSKFFKMKFSPMFRKFGANGVADWLETVETKHLSASDKAHIARAEALSAKIDAKCAELLAEEASPNVVAGKSVELKMLKDQQVANIKNMVGSERAAVILNQTRYITNHLPPLYITYASGAEANEEADAFRLGESRMADEFSEADWNKAMNWSRGRSAASAAFLLGIGRFVEGLRDGRVSKTSIDPMLRKHLIDLDETVKNAIAAGDYGTIQAISDGFSVSLAEEALVRWSGAFKMGYGMGATEKLLANMEDASISGNIPLWDLNEITKGVDTAGTIGGVNFVIGEAGMHSAGFMKNATLNSLAFHDMFMRQRQAMIPTEIISSHLAMRAMNNRDNLETIVDESGTPVGGKWDDRDVKTAMLSFQSRLGEWFDNVLFEGDADKKMEASKEWRKRNIELFGEDGANNFDFFVRNIQHAPREMFKDVLNNTLARMDESVITKVLTAAGAKVSNVVKLENGDIELDMALTRREVTADGGAEITNAARFLIHNGRIAVKVEGGKFAQGVVMDAISLAESGERADLKGIWDGLTDEQKDSVRSGNDVNGFLELASRGASGYFANKEVVAGGDANTVDVDNKDVYQGIAVIGGNSHISDVRHEMLGHAAIELLKKTKQLSESDIKALEDAYGKDWEEKLARDIQSFASISDGNIIARMIGDNKATLIDRVRATARSFAEKIAGVKRAVGDKADWDVSEFIDERVKEATETYKLHEEQRKASEHIKAAMEEQRRTLQEAHEKARKEAEVAIIADRERRKLEGQERAVRIAKEREITSSIGSLVDDLALKYDSEDKFNDPKTGFDARFEKAKGEVINKLKSIGLEKSEVGKIIEDIMLKARDEAKSVMKSEFDAMRKAAEEKARADETAKREAEELKVKTKADAEAKVAEFNRRKQMLEAKAENKKAGARMAKEIATARSTYFSCEDSIYGNLNSIEDVHKFDKENKRILHQFDRMLRGVRPEIAREFRNQLKQTMYETRKAMEKKADHLRALKEKADAEAKAKKEHEKKVAEAKRVAEKAARDAIRATAKKEAEAKKIELAKTRQKESDAKALVQGAKLMQAGQAIPTYFAEAGLSGKALAKKREFLRNAGYYFSKELDAWVCKKSTPKAFKKAADETVKNTVKKIAEVSKLTTTGIKGKDNLAFIMGLNNALEGRVVEKSKGVKPAAGKPEPKPKTAKQTAEESYRADVENALVEQLRQMGMPESEISNRVKLLRQTKLEVPVETVVDEGAKTEESKAEQPKQEEKKDPSLISNAKEAKAWWNDQLTPQEKLSLAIVYVDGKPWNIIHCAGEIVSGAENITIDNGEIPDGAEIRPFSTRGFNAYIESLGDDLPFDRDRDVEGSLKHKPFFNAELERARREERKRKMEENAAARAEAEKVAKAQEEFKAIEAMKRRVGALEREIADFDEQIKKPVVDFEKLNLGELSKLVGHQWQNEPKEKQDAYRKALVDEMEAVKKAIGDTAKEPVELGKSLKGNYSISTSIEPEAKARLDKMLPKLAKIIEKHGSNEIAKDRKHYTDEDYVRDYLKSTDLNDEAHRIVANFLAAIDITTSSADGRFMQEYVETLDVDSATKSFEEAQRILVDTGDNEFRLDFFLGEDSPILNKFPFLNNINVRFAVGDETGGALAYYASPTEAHKYGEIVLGEKPTLSSLCHEIQHAFQYEENQGFITYTGSDKAQWNLDKAENQAESVANRAYLNAKQRRENGAPEASEMELRGDQTEFVHHEESDSYVNLSMLPEPYKSEIREMSLFGANRIAGDFNITMSGGIARGLVDHFNMTESQARSWVEDRIDEFISGPVSLAAKKLIESGAYSGKSRIPNWVLNKQIETDGNGAVVTLPNGVKLRMAITGYGGNTMGRIENAEGESGLMGDIVFEYEGDKVRIPHHFFSQYDSESKKLKDARDNEITGKVELKTKLASLGLSGVALKKLEQSGITNVEEPDVELRTWTVSDFIKDSNLAMFYPEIYEGTKVYIEGSEQLKTVTGGDKGEKPVFLKDSLATLDANGDIIIKRPTGGEQVRIGDRVEQRLSRDIAACIAKKIMMKQGAAENSTASTTTLVQAISGFEGKKKGDAFKAFSLTGSVAKDKDGNIVNVGDDRLNAMLEMAIRKRFEQYNESKVVEALGLEKKDVEAAIAKVRELVAKKIAEAHNSFIDEREAVMFANRFGISEAQMNEEPMSDATKATVEGSVIRPNDKRFTSEDRSLSYANFYASVLDAIDAEFSEGTKQHADRRSIRSIFDELLTQYLFLKKPNRAKGKVKVLSNTIVEEIDGYTRSAINNGEAGSAIQREGNKSLEEGGSASRVATTNTTAADILEAREEAANNAEVEKPVKEEPESVKLKRTAANKIVNVINNSMVGGQLRGDKIAKAIGPDTPLYKEISDIVAKVYPKQNVSTVIQEWLLTAIRARSASAGPITGEKAREHIAGQFSISTNKTVEEDMTSAVAARIAWQKARHRDADINAIANDSIASTKKQFMDMGVPERDAETLARSVVNDAKFIANDIIGGIEEDVAQTTIVAKARTKAAQLRIGNSIYRNFRKGYNVATGGDMAYERAKTAMEKAQLRAAKNATGYSITELDGILGMDCIKDLARLGREGSKYANGKELSDSMLSSFCDKFREDNSEYANATREELFDNPQFKAQYAATISSWLANAAKFMASGRERDTLIKDAARIKYAPFTVNHIAKSVAHYAELIGNMVEKVDVEKMLHNIEKMIDTKPKIGEDGKITIGADGGSAKSETARAYNRAIAPRLQEYWKFVKDCIWYDGEKVDSEIARLQKEIGASDEEVEDIVGKTASELDADKLLKRDIAVMKINALHRYGALKNKTAGEVMDVMMNDIAKDIGFAAEKFLTERQAKLDEYASVRGDLLKELTGAIESGKSRDDIGALHRAARWYSFFSTPELFAKLAWNFKGDSKAKAHINAFRQRVSLAHADQMRLESDLNKKFADDVKSIYGEDLESYCRHACIKDSQYDRFIRSNWTVPEKGKTETVWTGKFYSKDVTEDGKVVHRKGDKIMRTVTIAVPAGHADSDPTHIAKHLSMDDLVYIYAAIRQPDMAINNVVFGRDEAYISDLARTIGPKGIALANKLVENFTLIRDAISPVSEKVTGMPVRSPNSNYVPLSFEQDKHSERTTRYEVNPFPRFLMNRKYHDSARLVENVGATSMFINHAKDAAHYYAWGELANDTRMTIGHEKVVTQYYNLYGKNIAESLFKQLRETFNGGERPEGMTGAGFRNFVTATTLGYNPSSCLKQLEGVGGWAVGGLGPVEWMKLVTWDRFFGEGIKDAVYDIHNSGLFKKNNLFGYYERNEDISEPMVMLMQARDKSPEAAQSYYTRFRESARNHSMDLVRFFDSVATHSCAASYYASRKAYYESVEHKATPEAKRLALADMDYMIQIGETSSRPEFLHEFQRSGIAGRLLTQFAGPTLIRVGVEIEALHRAFMVDRSPEAFKKLGSKLFATHITCPSILTTVSQITSFVFGFRDDKNAKLWDDFSTNLIISMCFGSLSGMFLIGSVANATVRRVASSKSSYGRAHYETPIASKLGEIASSLMTTTQDAWDAYSPLLNDRDVNKMAEKRLRRDTIRTLQHFFPIMLLFNAYNNIGAAWDMSKREEERERIRSGR